MNTNKERVFNEKKCHKSLPKMKELKNTTNRVVGGAASYSAVGSYGVVGSYSAAGGDDKSAGAH